MSDLAATPVHLPSETELVRQIERFSGSDYLYLDDYDVDKEGRADSQLAIVQAILDGDSQDKPIVVNGGTYYCNSVTFINAISVRFVFLNNPRFVFSHEAELSIMASANKSMVQNGDVSRLDRVISYTTATEAPEVGDRIMVGNSTVAETHFNYQKKGLHQIVSISGQTLTVDRPFRFDYGAAETGAYMNLLKNGSAFSAQGEFSVHKEGINTVTRANAITLRQFSSVSINSVNIKGDGKYLEGVITTSTVGISMLGCSNVWIGSVYAETISYPIYIAEASLGVVVDRFFGRSVRHSVECNHFSESIYLRNFRGIDTDGLISAHIAFDLNFYNVDDLCTQTPFNFRAIGGSIVGAKIRIDESCVLFGPYISNSAMVDASFYDDLVELGLKTRYQDIVIEDRRTGALTSTWHTFTARGGYVDMHRVEVHGPNAAIGSTQNGDSALKRFDSSGLYLNGASVSPALGVVST